MSEDFEVLLTRLSEIHRAHLEADDLRAKYDLMIEADEIRVTISLVDPPAEQVKTELAALHAMADDLEMLIFDLEGLHALEMRAGKQFTELPLPAIDVKRLMEAQLVGVKDRISHLETHFASRGTRTYRRRPPAGAGQTRVNHLARTPATGAIRKVRAARRHPHPDD